ncbi:hypothetical protein C8J57DRAFT_1492392 [Mycena rebaudengoi]|nr:hypothetical protein C8J57DRAFT_1492392 [Mycena rebaudengoi]
MAATADWDPPMQSTSSRRAPAIPKTVIPVSDDWEDDVEEDEAQNGEDNQRIWENANARAPMPSLIVSGSSHAATAPPPAAFQPKMRILKRPTNSGPAEGLQQPVAAGETLKEREARYQAARDRIFGGEAEGTSTPEKKDGRSSPAGVAVVRNPRGPAAEAPNSASKGFRARSGNPPPSPNPVRDSDSTANPS